MVYIYKDGKTVSRSKNLQGILAYARKHGIAAMSVIRSLTTGATLLVNFKDGASTYCDFADYNLLIKWLSERKSWPKQYRNW